MNNLSNDPRLTLYALGQLSQDEAKEIEMELKKDEQLQREVQEIQETATLLKDGMDTKAHLRLSPEQIENLSRKYEQKPGWLARNFKKVTIGVPLVFVVTFTVISLREIATNRLNKTTKQPLNIAQGILQESKSSTPYNPPAVAQNYAPAPAKKAMRKAELQAPSINSFGNKGIGKRSALTSSEALGQAPVQSEFNTETYDYMSPNGYVRVADHPLSTFSVDVDTASYANARRFLSNAQMPPKDSIRVEEFINYFDYDYSAPKDDAKHPVAVYTEVATSPFHKDYKLVKIGLKAKEVLMEKRPRSNLVFLIDVSGSMSDPNKLPLVKESIKQMVRKMDKEEMISIVVYAGSSGLALPPTPASDNVTIFEALGRLSAGGSTNGGQGIELAYKVAKENFIKEGNNRVIIVTDGDFNVGQTSQGTLVDTIKEKAKDNIFLTVLGVGMGNYKDSTLEKLADYGNGNYAYIDNLNEARKVLINDRFKTLHTIAKDVKLQVEFNPDAVEAYRLIGYENRALKKEDFNNDKKDAGDMGAGHTVTAFYEIVPKGVKFEGPAVDKLKYQKVSKATTKTTGSNEVMTVKVRYKEPAGTKSKLLEQVVSKNDQTFSSASSDFKFASAVAGYAMLLREDPNLGDMGLSEMVELAKENKGSDPFDYREELIENMKMSQSIYERSKNWK